MTLKNESDYELIGEGDDIIIEGFRQAVECGDEAVLVNRKNGARVPLVLSFSERQRKILLAGGTLNYTKNSNK